jgi:hypothetical protein
MQGITGSVCIASADVLTEPEAAASSWLLHHHCSFIASAGSHGHHGQVPRGEYLMALSAHTEGPTGAPLFLTSDEFSRLCLELSLPVNDTWLVAGNHFAQKARELLDDMSTQVGCTTYMEDL